MVYGQEKFLLMNKRLDVPGGAGGVDTAQIEETDLIFGPKEGDFQLQEYKVSKEITAGGYTRLHIDNSGANTIIEIRGGKEYTDEQLQRILNNFYKNNYRSDTFWTEEIHIYVPTPRDLAPHVPAPVAADVARITARDMEPVEDETRVQQLQAKLTELQKTQPDLYKALTSEGILLNTIENTEQLVRLSRYIDYLNFLYTVTRVSDDDPAETSREIGAQGKIDLVRRYKELRSEETDDILHKELIEYKYLEAILRDVVRMGYVIRRKKQGTGYEVVNQDGFKVESKKADAIGVYAEVLDLAHLNPQALDTAIMANIIVGNPVDFQSVVGQKQFINTLFKRHGILLSVSDEDKSNYIVDKKDTITAEIEAKLKDPTSIRDYQELSYLLSFVNGWEPGKDTATYNQANTYAKGFLAEKTFIDAYRAGKIDGLDPDLTTEEQLANFIRTNRLTSIGFGVVAWLMGYQKTALGAIGLGLFGGTVADVIEGVGKKGRDVVRGIGEDIDPIRKNQVAKLLRNSDYQERYEQLVAFNFESEGNSMKKRNGVYVETTVEVLPKDRLFLIVNAMTRNAIDIDVNDPNASVELHDQLMPVTPSGEEPTQDELDSFLDMLRKSDLKEDGDVTVLDYLVSGQDILNRGYAPKDYSGVDTFDAQLNTELQKVYDNDSGTNLDKRKRRQKVEAAQRVMSEKLSIVRSYISGVMGGKFSSESHSTRVQSLNAELTALDSKLADTLKPIIESYSLYLELEIEIKPFEGSWGANRNDVLDGMYTVLGLPGKLSDTVAAKATEKKAALANEIEIQIGTISSLIRKLEPHKTKKGFSELLRRAESVKAKLEAQLKQLQHDIHDADYVETTQSGILDSDGFVEAYHLRPQELSQQIQTSLQAVQTFNIEALTTSNLEGQLKDLGDGYITLVAYEEHTNFNQIALTDIRDASQAGDRATYAAIERNLATFQSLQDPVKQKVETALTQYSQGNQEKLDSLAGITDASSLSDDLVVLREAREYLREKRIVLADPQKEAMQGLVQTSEALRQAVQALRDQLAAQPNLTPQQTQQIELYDRVIQGWESLNREYISPALSTAAIEFGVLDDRIDSLYRRMVIDLRAINVASIEPQLDNAINAIDALRGLVVETNLDEEAKAGLEKAREVLGPDFMVGVDLLTLAQVLTAYRGGESKVEEKVEAKINFDITTVNTPAEIKVKVSELLGYRELFPEKSTRINGRLLELIKKMPISGVDGFDAALVEDTDRMLPATPTATPSNKYLYLKGFLSGNIQINGKSIGQALVGDVLSIVTTSTTPNNIQFDTGSGNMVTVNFTRQDLSSVGMYLLSNIETGTIKSKI